MNEKSQLTVDPQERAMYRVGGLAALILGIGYLLTFPVITYAGGFPPPGVEAGLAFFAEHAAGWWAIAGLMIFTDLLYLPVFLGLYQALKGINKNMMLLAIAFEGLFVALDLAVTWTAYSSLIMLGQSYGTATSDAQRALIVAGAGYPSAVLDSPVAGACAILMPSLGFVLMGLVMLKGIFNKSTGYLAVVTGLSGIIFMGSYFADALTVFRYINALLAMLFYLLAGYQLYRLARQVH